MPRLGRKRQQGGLEQSGGPTTGSTRQHLDFQSDQVFAPPLIGIYRGQVVAVHARGNTKGMSATFWITNQQSQNQIASLNEVQILAPSYMAPTTEQVDLLLQGVNFPDQQ
jgi:hypothetical protein